MMNKLAILIIICIFVTQTTRNETPFKIINNPEQAHGCKSLHYSTHFDVVCSDLLYFNFNIMQTTISGKEINNISTTVGFIKRYFDLLPYSRTFNEAFVKTSVEYFNIHQSFMFNSLFEFQCTLYGKS